MSRSVYKSYTFIAYFNGICAYVLRYTASFSCGNFGLSDIIEKGSFTVVNVTHNGYDRCTGNELFNLFKGIRLLFGKNFFRSLFGLVFKLYAEIRGN